MAKNGKPKLTHDMGEDSSDQIVNQSEVELGNTNVILCRFIFQLEKTQESMSPIWMATMVDAEALLLKVIKV